MKKAAERKRTLETKEENEPAKVKDSPDFGIQVTGKVEVPNFKLT